MTFLGVIFGSEKMTLEVTHQFQLKPTKCKSPGQIENYLYALFKSFLNMRLPLLLLFKIPTKSSIFGNEICQRITTSITFMYFKLGYMMINYLDDFGGAETKEKDWKAYETLGELLMSCGLEES
jgi:hypothetical protein